MDAMRCVMSRRYNKREQRSVSNGDWFHHEKNRGMRQKPLWTAAEEACAKEHISKAEQQKIFFLVGVFAFKTDSGTYCHLHLNQWAIVELPSLSNQDKILPIIHQSFWLWPPTTFAPHAHPLLCVDARSSNFSFENVLIENILVSLNKQHWAEKRGFLYTVVLEIAL